MSFPLYNYARLCVGLAHRTPLQIKKTNKKINNICDCNTTKCKKNFPWIKTPLGTQCSPFGELKLCGIQKPFIHANIKCKVNEHTHTDTHT